MKEPVRLHKKPEPKRVPSMLIFFIFIFILFVISVLLAYSCKSYYYSPLI